MILVFVFSVIYFFGRKPLPKSTMQETVLVDNLKDVDALVLNTTYKRLLYLEKEISGSTITISLNEYALDSGTAKSIKVWVFQCDNGQCRAPEGEILSETDLKLNDIFLLRQSDKEFIVSDYLFSEHAQFLTKVDYSPASETYTTSKVAFFPAEMNDLYFTTKSEDGRTLETSNPFNIVYQKEFLRKGLDYDPKVEYVEWDGEVFSGSGYRYEPSNTSKSIYDGMIVLAICKGVDCKIVALSRPFAN